MKGPGIEKVRSFFEALGSMRKNCYEIPRGFEKVVSSAYEIFYVPLNMGKHSGTNKKRGLANIKICIDPVSLLAR